MTFDEIAEFILDGTCPPESALEMGATLLIDTLGVAAAAAPMEAGLIAREHAIRFLNSNRKGDSSALLFDGRQASLAGAAFALASQIDNLDAHDGYNPTKGHIGCAVVPALCAFAEHLPELGARDALSALVMSYEVSARAAIALHDSVSDYHTSGAWNALGVAALGARLRRFDSITLKHALGIAEYHGPRSQMMREIANPTMLHDGSGMGAMVGVMAALMAESGFTGAPAITVEEAPEHWADLGQLWTVELNYIKPYPICRWAHAAIDALGQVLEDNALTADDIAAIKVNTFAESAQLYQGVPATTSQAQYSLPFALAVRLCHGRIGAEHISGTGLSDPDVCAALALIDVHESPRHSERFPLGRWSDVTVRLKNGAELYSGDVHARGGPEAPISLAEVEQKFTSLTAPLGATRSTAIWQMREQLLAPDAKFSELLALLHPAV